MYYITNKEIPSSSYGHDCPLPQGTILYPFLGATYGCIGPGYAVSLNEGENPFFEVDRKDVNKINGYQNYNDNTDPLVFES